MDSSKLLILAAVGLGAYFLMSSQARAGTVPQYRVPGQNATGAPRYPTAPTIAGAAEAAAYRDIGSLVGGIYNKVFGGGSSSSGSSGSTLPSGLTDSFTGLYGHQGIMIGDSPVYVPEDGLAVNLPNNYDTSFLEQSFWGASR